MLLFFIISDSTALPSLGDALSKPCLMSVLGYLLDQSENVRRKLESRCVERSETVLCVMHLSLRRTSTILRKKYRAAKH